MLKHDQIWSAIDALAARNGMSASGLAKRAGLDPTTFNRSKRMTPGGRQRWPSTESVAKILMATNETIDTFVALISPQNAAGSLRLPLIGSEAAASGDAFSAAGAPQGARWSETALQGLQGERSFVLEVETAGLTPLYREGTLLAAVHGAPVRRGDRVIVRLQTLRLLIGEVKRETTGTLDLTHCTVGQALVSFPRSELDWVARIIWASQ